MQEQGEAMRGRRAYTSMSVSRMGEGKDKGLWRCGYVGEDMETRKGNNERTVHSYRYIDHDEHPPYVTI